MLFFKSAIEIISPLDTRSREFAPECLVNFQGNHFTLYL
jgi:hypothetical protein